MATPTQFTLYNGALFLLEQPELSSVDEDKEARHVLDHFYEDKDAREDCLEMGNWNFATRTVKIEYNSDIDPDFGLQRAFTKPSDWVKTTEMASDEYFDFPMTDKQYKDEQGYFFADVDVIYVRYVSDDSSYGKDFSLWPKSFEALVEHYLAWKIAPRINSKKTVAIKKEFEDARKNARSKDALQEGVKFPPQTGWQAARRRGGRSGRDIGSRHSLTG
jgi:hypothetical protein|tara:strand:+ start:1198 stop:1851 length:654 start_codon:yes stop_codon:yes gene_type:complete